MKPLFIEYILKVSTIFSIIISGFVFSTRTIHHNQQVFHVIFSQTTIDSGSISFNFFKKENLSLVASQEQNNFHALSFSPIILRSKLFLFRTPKLIVVFISFLAKKQSKKLNSEHSPYKILLYRAVILIK